MRIIFHLDLDAFFCAVEELNNPILKTKPFAIAKNNNRSVISTANYIAREYGIKSAMKVYDAKQKCSSLIIIEPKMEKYVYYSRIVFEFIRDNFSRQIIIHSIDECDIDITNILHKYHNNYKILAHEIQQKILKKIGLSISIGISENCILAKIASDFNKPFGISTLFIDEIKTKIYHKPISIIPGIGAKTNLVLNQLGIQTIANFINYNNIEELQRLIGKKHWLSICKIINGQIDDDWKDDNSENKTISKTNKLLVDEQDLDRIIIQLNHLVDEFLIENDLETLKAKNIVIRLKYGHNINISKSKMLKDNYVTQTNIRKLLIDLLVELWDGRPISSLSVGLGKFQFF